MIHRVEFLWPNGESQALRVGRRLLEVHPPEPECGRRGPEGGELGWDPCRGPARVHQHPIDVDPGQPRAVGIVELRPAAGPDAPPTDDLGRPDKFRPDRDRAEDRDLRGANQPGDTAFGVPVPHEPPDRGVVTGQVLRVAQQD